MSSVSQPCLSDKTSSALLAQRLAKLESDTSSDSITLEKVVLGSQVLRNVNLGDPSSSATMIESACSIKRSPSPTSVMCDISPYVEQTKPKLPSDVNSISRNKMLQNAAIVLSNQCSDDKLNEQALNTGPGKGLQRKVKNKAVKNAYKTALSQAHKEAAKKADADANKKMTTRQRQLQKRANWSRKSYTRTVDGYGQSKKKASGSATQTQTIGVNVSSAATVAYQGIAHEVVTPSLHVPVKVKHSETATVTVRQSATVSKQVTVNPESFKKMASNMKQKCRGWLSSQCMRSSSRPTNPEANVAPATT